MFFCLLFLLGWFFYNQHHTLSTFCFPVWKTAKQKTNGCFCERGAPPPPLAMGRGFIWLCNLTKSISQERRQSHHVNAADSDVISLTDSVTVFIYLFILEVIFLLKRRQTFLVSQESFFLAVWFIDIRSFNKIYRTHHSPVRLQCFRPAVSRHWSISCLLHGWRSVFLRLQLMSLGPLQCATWMCLLFFPSKTLIDFLSALLLFIPRASAVVT